MACLAVVVAVGQRPVAVAEASGSAPWTASRPFTTTARRPARRVILCVIPCVMLISVAMPPVRAATGAGWWSRQGLLLQ